jgi:exodeoxyribonuclease V alpha subunit
MSEEITGCVVKLFFQGPAFCAGRLLPSGGSTEIAFSGKIYVCEDQIVTFRGEWVIHTKYGRQFEVKSIVSHREIDANGLVSWLERRGRGHGIGFVKAKKIVAEFYPTFKDTLLNQPELIANFAGVPVKGVQEIASYYGDHEDEIRSYADLAALGLTDFLCNTLWAKYKGASLALIRDNPYRLADEVNGIGFAKADEIAKNVGIAGTHPARIRAAVLHAIQMNQDNGSTCIDLDKLVEMAAKLLGSDENVATGVATYVADGDIAQIGDRYAIPSTAMCERNIADFLARMNTPRTWVKDIEAGIAKHGDFLDDDQKAAVRLALTRGVCIITGPAGSGKTTVVNTIVKILNDVYIHASLCAPTGKAARRMEEIIGQNAFTIHRLLAYQPPNVWNHNRDNPLPDDVIICDEVSMNDSFLSWNLMQSVRPSAAMILVGDHNQLPPVGPGAFLRDAIQHKLVPVADLHQVHRNAGALRQNSAAVLDGKLAPTAPRLPNGKPEWVVLDNHVSESTLLPMLDNLFLDAIPALGYDPVLDVQFMSPRRKGVSLCSEMLSERFQVLHQKRLGRSIAPTPPKRRAILYEGDKVIQTKNNYNLDVMNGTLGIVVEAGDKLKIKFDTMDEPLTIPNECKGDIDLAYWLTVHKMQGAQCPVAVVLCWGAHLGGYDAPMLHRNLVYTALTRARECTFLVGDSKGVKVALSRKVENQRLTLLPVFARKK